MLKYSVRLSTDNFKESELEWSERYLDPNLSFVSGVTDSSYHLEKFNKLNVTNSLIDSDGIINLEASGVTRQGFIIVKEKEYEVLSDKLVDYSVNQEGDKREYNYVFINGKYFYEKKKENSEDKVFTITNWLKVQDDGIVIEDTVEKQKDGNTLKLDTVYWIEDGTVSIDGETYIFDKDEILGEGGKVGALKYFEDGDVLEATSITKCNSIEFCAYTSSNDYKEVTKFRLTKDDEVEVPFERITHSKYFFYVIYKNHYCPIKQVFEGENYSFKCEVPKYVLSATSIQWDDGLEEFDVCFVTEGDATISAGTLNVDNIPITNSNVEQHGVLKLSDLLNTIPYVIIDKSVFYVQNDIQNANSGKQIAVYLEGTHDDFSVGDKIRFTDTSNESYSPIVYFINNNPYGFDKNNDHDFIMFGCKKYFVEKNICDKVVINGSEYDIDYINGKVKDKDCLVRIGDEEVPFKISDDTETAGTLTRYGRIISGTSKEAVEAVYNITPYSGVTINNTKYIIRNDGETTYAELDKSNEYIYEITDIRGSSMLICEPSLSETEYTRDFIDFMASNISDDLVNNQRSFFLYSKNKVFGSEVITKELAFETMNEPSSSDDYYNLLDNLIVFSKNGYLNVPLLMGTEMGNNILQDDIVGSEFFKKEKEKAINPIIDMEKDVYLPKFIVSNDGEYEGSRTEFHPISKINVNLHFRTRNMDNWKVNEGYNNYETSGKTDNWFITDFHPYKEILESNQEEYGDSLQQVSDLMGLLYFTNFDIYYQKQKVAKSFLRFSFYDSIDPQKQQLLCTSTVFVDEHALFKKFIDNSRKNVYDYAIIREPQFLNGEEVSETKDGGSITTKISVMSEFIDKADKIRHINENAYKDHYSFEDTDNVVDMMVKDSRRISSRLTIQNKYETDTSSEGFYIYIFREYSEKLIPKPIYMKVEFNHAGIGKSIPFVIPMKWEDVESGETRPVSALKMSVKDELDEMKSGFTLSYTYAQSYIPLYAVYDFENKEYGYVFDSRYVTQPTVNDDEAVINLNLFEMKIANEDKAPTDREKQLITRKQKIKAIINQNERQFPLMGVQCRND